MTRAEASRINGAKSKGPKTEEGKKRSSRNALKHGLASPFILLPQESPETFQRLCGEYTRHFNPQNEVERDLVYEAVSCMWRILRIQAAESSLIEIEISRQRQEVDKKFINPDDWVRLAMAFENLANNGRALALISRYESRMMRAKDRAMEQLRKLRAEPQPDEPEDDEPDENLPSEPEPMPEPNIKNAPNEPETAPEISTEPEQTQPDAVMETAPEAARNEPENRPAPTALNPDFNGGTSSESASQPLSRDNVPMSDVVYRSEVRIERVAGPLRRAYLPKGAEPVKFGFMEPLRSIISRAISSRRRPVMGGCDGHRPTLHVCAQATKPSLRATASDPAFCHEVE